MLNKMGLEIFFWHNAESKVRWLSFVLETQEADTSTLKNSMVSQRTKNLMGTK